MGEEKSPGGQPGDQGPGSPQETHHSIQQEPNEAEQTPEELRKSKRRRRRNLGIVLVCVVLALFLIYHFSRSTSGGAAGGKAGAQAPAAITVGQSRSGDINIYVTALGTVTPIYTVTVYSQITGRVMSVHYREGQMVRKGDRADRHRPAPLSGDADAGAREIWSTIKGVLAQARMDYQRYKDAYARNAIAKQQLDDQEQLVTQTEGTVKADRGNGGLRPGATGVLPYRRSHQRPGWAASGGPGEHHFFGQQFDAGGDYAGAADHGGVQRRRRTICRRFRRS